MKFNLLVWILICLIFSACKSSVSISKRRYSSGYYVSVQSQKNLKSKLSQNLPVFKTEAIQFETKRQNQNMHSTCFSAIDSLMPALENKEKHQVKSTYTSLLPTRKKINVIRQMKNNLSLENDEVKDFFYLFFLAIAIAIGVIVFVLLYKVIGASALGFIVALILAALAFAGIMYLADTYLLKPTFE